MALRAVFAGTAPFSVPSLHATAQHCELVAVVTQPDRPGSRGKPAPRPVADAAIALGVPVLQPERIRRPEATAEVLAVGADVLVVAAYGQILPQALLDGFRLGGVNVHASLLPRWRGAAPIAAVILAGDEVTGISIMQMEAGLDTGPVFATRSIAVGPHATTPQLTDELAALGAALLGETLDGLAAGQLPVTPQDDALATLAPRLTRDDGKVDWSVHTAVQVERMVRGLLPWPGVTAPLAGLDVRIWSGDVVDAASPASVTPDANETSVLIGAADATTFRIDEVQAPGSRRMDAVAYLRGRRL